MIDRMDTINFNTDFADTLSRQWKSQGATGIAVAPLCHLGVIGVAGPDAASFLQGQLTQDVATQKADEARLSALCQPKGRMLASFLQLRNPEASEADNIQLVVSRDIAPATARRLGMYVLRAKAKVDDVSTQYVLFGLMLRVGVELPASVARFLPGTSIAVNRTAGCTSVRMNDVHGVNRWLAIVAVDQAPDFWRECTKFAQAVGPIVWRQYELHAGVPRIEAVTQEKFVPQMVNFELIGGVNFKKGCYPGQEIVARSQYLGKLRRRMFLVHGDSECLPLPGGDVRAEAHDQAVGTVVNIEPGINGGFEALIELPHDLLDRQLQISGKSVNVIALPYAVPMETSSNA
jgi:folate-binding protein YgfZ